METINGFEFFRLHYDADGNPQQGQELTDFKNAASTATDSIWLAHGFRNDEDDATGLYTRFLQNLRQHVDGPFHASLGARKFVVSGVYWPSKQFSEGGGLEGSTQGLDDELAEKAHVRARLIELRDTMADAGHKPKIDLAIQQLDHIKDSSAAQDQFIGNVLSLLDGSEMDPTEGLDKVRSKSGSELLDALATPIGNPLTLAAGGDGGVAGLGDVFVPGDDAGGTQGLGSVFGSIFGKVGQFLNLTTWYEMKNRSGVVGATGVAAAIRDVRTTCPGVKIHLAGHSLGGRLMAACAKTLAQDPIVHVDSLTLLEAAFSHFGFSADNGQHQVGFFRPVVEKQLVKGPFVATFSAQDSVVGTVYAVASRLAGDNLQAIGDANDPYGGLGRNGTQKTAEAATTTLHTAGTPYSFTPGQILNLDGSGGLITDHGDVTNPNVTYAFASVVAAT